MLRTSAEHAANDQMISGLSGAVLGLARWGRAMGPILQLGANVYRRVEMG